MEIFSHLLSAIASTTRDGWESLYTEFTGSADRSLVVDMIDKHPEGALWLLLRMEAGPCGTALPPAADAITRLRAGQATIADAHVVVFGADASAASAGADLPELLEQCVRVALAADARPTAQRCIELLALSHVIAGEPASARDVLETSARPWVADERLFYALEQLITQPELLRTTVLRGAIALQWRGSMLPALPPPEWREAVQDSGPELWDVIAALRQVRSHDLVELIDEWLAIYRYAAIFDIRDHPTILRIVELAAREVISIDDIPELDIPHRLREWALAELRAQRVQNARIAAHLLWRQRAGEYDDVIALLRMTARACDLSMLCAALDQGSELYQQMAGWFRSVQEVVAEVEPQLADAIMAFLNRTDDMTADELRLVYEARELAQRLTDVAPDLMYWAIKHLAEKDEHKKQRLGCGQTGLDALMARARDVIAEAGGVDALAPERLLEIMRAARPPRLDERILILLSMEIHSRCTLAHLVASLWIRVWTPPDSGKSKELRLMATELAAIAIVELERVDFFPLRFDLLDELLEEHGTVHATRASLLRSRANTRQAIAPLDTEQLSLAVRDIRESIAHSHAEDDLDGEILTITGWASMVTRMMTIESPWARAQQPELRAAVARVRERASTAEQRAQCVLNALCLDKTLRDPFIPEVHRATLEELRQSIRGRLRQDIDVLLAQHYLAAHQLERADELATSILDQLPEDGKGDSRRLAHSILGSVLNARGDRQAAREHLEAALSLHAAPQYGGETALIRITLARILEAQGHTAHACQQLEYAVAESRAAGDHNVEIDAALALAQILYARGDRRQCEQVLRELDASLYGSALAPLTLLARLGFRSPEPLGAAELALLGDYAKGGIPSARWADTLVARTAGAHLSELDGAARAALLAWALAGGREPALAARLLELAGQRAQARDLLEGYLAQETPDVMTDAEQRLDATALLAALLPATDRSTVLVRVDEAEQLLGESPGHPAARLNLAVALMQAAEHDSDLLERARGHADAAVDILRAFGFGPGRALSVQAQIRLELLIASCDCSSEAQAERGRWFLGEPGLAQPKLAELHMSAAWYLLAPGPVVRADCVHVCEQLVDRAREHMAGNQRFQRLEARMRWISACIHGTPGASAPHALDDEMPGDRLPQALIDLAHGRIPSVPAHELSACVDMLPVLIQARPDRAAAVLDWIVSIADGITDPEQQRTMRGAVELAGLSGIEPRALQELAARLQATLAQHKSRALQGIFDRLMQVIPGMPRSLSEIRSAEFEGQASVRERVETLVRKGTESSHAALQRGPYEQQRDAIEQARSMLDEAVQLCEQGAGVEDLFFAALVSAGNAWRYPPDSDLGKAIDYYARAEAMAAPSEHESARLAKCKADALLERGQPDDARQAKQLLLQALKVRRSGPMRAATLGSLHRAELQQPDVAEPTRIRRAVERLEQALEHLPAVPEPDDILGALAALLARWCRLEPQDPRPPAVLDGLMQRYPGRQAQWQKARRGVGPRHPDIQGDELRQVVEHVEHAALGAFEEATRTLQTRQQIEHTRAQTRQILSNGPTEHAEVMDKHFEQQLRDSLHDKPRELATFAASLRATLAREPSDNVRAGTAVGLALILSRLAELGHAQPRDVEDMVELARAALAHVTPPQVRGMLLLKLARVWSPSDQADHPMRDFARAADLCREVMSLIPAESMLYLDALRQCARATQHRNDGDLEAHYRDARTMYMECAERYRRQGNTQELAQTMRNLAVLETAPGTADMKQRRARALELMREAWSLVEDGPSRHSYSVGLFASLLDMADVSHGDPRARLLEEAGQLERTIDEQYLGGVARRELGNRRRIHAALGAQGEQGWRSEEDRDSALAPLYQALEEIDREQAPAAWATAAHNLAYNLLCPPLSLPVVLHALALCREALALRDIDIHPDKHWETAFMAGNGYLSLFWHLHQGGDPGAGIAPTECLAIARVLFQSAIAAANRIGPGSQLARSALRLARVACMLPSTDELASTAEEAWQALMAALPTLLHDEDAARDESRLALDITRTLLQRKTVAASANAGPNAVPRALINGEHAAAVLTWLVRAMAGQQRRLVGRLRRPAGVSHREWMTWLAALRGGGDVTLETRDIQRSAPGFLSGEANLDHTWQWLAGARDRAAVLVWSLDDSLLVGLLDHPGERRVQILEIAAASPPHSEEKLAGILGKPIRETPAGSFAEQDQALQRMLEWLARSRLVELVRERLGGTPGHLLWCPTGVLRLLPPHLVWGREVCVSMASAPTLEPLETMRRPRATLLIHADPEGNIQGLSELASLAGHVSRAGSMTTLVGIAGQYGDAVLRRSEDAIAGVRNEPPTVEAVLRHAQEHDRIVFLGHGLVDDATRAELQLMAAGGQVEALGPEHITQEPRRFAGATVLLMACEAGRVGDVTYRLGGLVGAFLACGARAVIAPLWPVSRSVATMLGERVLLELGNGSPPAEALRRALAPGAASGPLLGGRPPQDAGGGPSLYEQGAFVIWVG